LGQRPNELWCTDYKGEFLLGNHQYCYPLTVTDHASRFLLTCEALSSTRENYAFTVFERLFRERGLPANIRSDNGVPIASALALFNLSFSQSIRYGVRIDVHRRSNVCVSQQLLLDLQINSESPEHRGVGVTKRVPADAP
jgi:transposase InsO family protein